MKQSWKPGTVLYPLPAVLVTSPAEGLDYPNLSSVTTDDFEASVQAVRVLLEHGHRHIAIIGGRPSFSAISSVTASVSSAM